MNSHQLYFIAIICPEPFQTEITAIKNYFFDKYNCTVALKSPAHITLIPPFTLKHITEDNLLQYLNMFKINLPELLIELNGFGRFDKRTLFIKPQTNESLFRLQVTLQQYLIQKLPYLKTAGIFHPHVTIANRDLTRESFDAEWPDFKDRQFIADFTVAAFALLKLVEKKWQVIATINWRQRG